MQGCATACDIGRQLLRGHVLDPSLTRVNEPDVDLAFALSRAVRHEFDRVLDFDFDLIHSLVRGLVRALDAGRRALRELVNDTSPNLDAELTDHLALVMCLPDEE